MPIAINGSGTITGVSVGGLPDGIVDEDMLAANAVTAPKIGPKVFTSYAVIVDQKSANTEAGTFTSGAWQTRILQTKYDEDGIVSSISSNKFTLAAGNYFIVWSAPCYKVDKNQSRLYDVTNSAQITPLGSVEHAGTSQSVQVRSIGAVRVTPSGSTEYRIEHQSAATRADNGFGFAGNLATAEIFTIVEIYKEA
tara:strand:- start:242 stop:826 length:585 start_codon:yes stop_codon:yes gene_type:complete